MDGDTGDVLVSTGTLYILLLYQYESIDADADANAWVDIGK